jgi:hypothetical protein
MADADADGVPDVFQRPGDHIPAQTVSEHSEERGQPGDEGTATQ